MKNVSIVLTALAAMYLGGCATVTRGTTEPYRIESQPSGQEVRLSNSMVCITPCDLDLPRKQSLTATFENGCTANITSKISGGANVGAATANVLMFGILGPFVAIADSASGALNNLLPNPLVVSMDNCEVLGSHLSSVSRVKVPRNEARQYCRKAEKTNGMINKCITDVQSGEREVAAL